MSDDVTLDAYMTGRNLKNAEFARELLHEMTGEYPSDEKVIIRWAKKVQKWRKHGHAPRDGDVINALRRLTSDIINGNSFL